MAIAFSATVLLASFLMTQALRITLRRLLPKSIYQYVAECLCVFQLTSCVLENGILLGSYGTWVYAAGLFCLGLGYSLTFDAYGNPAAMLEQILKKKISIWNGILKMIAEVLGGLLAYRYILFVWSTFATTSVHRNRAEMMKDSCQSALQVNLMIGMCAEGLAMFVSRSVAGMGVGGPKYYKMVNSFTSVVVVISGLDWTGMMFNPALATALTYNCKGHHLYEHVVVYWLGPFIGTIMSIVVFHYIMEEHVDGEKTSTAKFRNGSSQRGEKDGTNGVTNGKDKAN
ncbi:aquaporin-11-like [Asterias rubens]|uniref:aquaporin-11-like n=1 Tax=Asterias rubens TaxID=7604 RepID=UPI0014550936|nr:aquaporin-11-like [Asterias rubens]XP_033639644.1 aquaporin-11-like [Asterias rubens]